MLQRQESEEDGSSVGSTLKSTATEKAIDMDKRDPLTGGLELSEKIKLIQYDFLFYSGCILSSVRAAK